MFVLCPKCWYELKAAPVACPNCGTRVDLYSREYEHQLVAALPRSGAERRAQICGVLGSRGKRSAVPALVGVLRDPDVFVRVAALRALAEIGDRSAVHAVEKLAGDENLAVRTVAKNVLKILGGAEATGAGHRRAG
jgi:HEAT repeat protein